MAKSKKKSPYSLQSFIALTIVVVCLLGIWIGIKLLEKNRTRSSGAESLPVECKLYAIQDSSTNDSQFFMVDIRNGSWSDFGPLHPDKDYEDWDFNPSTQELYAVSGINATNPGRLYKVDPITGFVTEIGNTGLTRGIQALSFRPTDNTLWGWSKNVGLYKINASTAKVELVKSDKNREIGGLAWSLDGKTLYFTTYTRELWKMDYPSMNETKIASDLLPNKIEALEMRPDGLLMLAFHSDKELLIRAYDPNAKKFVKEQGFQTSYADIEGLAWPEICGIPEDVPTPTPQPPSNCPGPITFEYNQVRGPEQTQVSNQYKDSHGVLFRLDTKDLAFRSRYPVIAIKGDPTVAFRPSDKPESDKVGSRFLTDRPGFVPYGGIYPILMTFSKPEFMSNQLEFDLIDPEETETFVFTGYQGSTQVFKHEWISAPDTSTTGYIAHVVLRTDKASQVIDRVKIEGTKKPAIGLGFAIDNINACNWWGR